MAGRINNFLKQFTPLQAIGSAAGKARRTEGKGADQMERINRNIATETKTAPVREDSRITEVVDHDNVSDKIEELRRHAQVIQAAARKKEEENAAETARLNKAVPVPTDLSPDEDAEGENTCENLPETAADAVTMEENPEETREDSIEETIEENIGNDVEEIIEKENQEENGSAEDEVSFAGEKALCEDAEADEAGSAETAVEELLPEETEKPLQEETQAPGQEAAYYAQALQNVETKLALLTERQQDSIDTMQQSADRLQQIRDQIGSLDASVKDYSRNSAQTMEGMLASQEQSFSEIRSAEEKQTRENADQVELIRHQIKSSMDEMAENLKDVRCEQLFVKSELADKIHSENVKSYGNIKELFKENLARQDEILNSLEELALVKKMVLISIILGGVNTAGLLLILLKVFGAF